MIESQGEKLRKRVYNKKMKKILKVIENTAQGLMVNGGFYLIIEKPTLKAVLATLLFFYVMVLAILLEED